MTSVETTCSKTLAFQPPTNLNAIRSSLLKRIHQKKQDHSLVLQASLPPSPLSMSSTSSSPQLLPTTKMTSLLDHGLPSPPVEYQKKHQVDTMDIDDQQQHGQDDDDEEDDAVSTISSLPPTNNTTTCTSVAALDVPSLCSSSSTSLSAESWNAQQLELKIKQLKEEKHQLFTQMKNLLQQEQEKPITMTVQPIRPSPLKTTYSLSSREKEESSLPSPSPSPTSTPKTTNLQPKQKIVLKSNSLPSSRSSHHTSSHHYQHHHSLQQQYRRRRSSLTSNNCLSAAAAAAAAAAMMTTPRYHPHSTTSSFGISSTNNNNNMIPSNSSSSSSSPSSSMTIDNNGRYRYSPYGGYFTPVSSPPPSGYNVRRPSYLPSRSTSSSHTSSIISVSSSSSSSNTFRPSRSLVNRHNPRY